MKRAIHDIIHDESSHMASFQLLSSIFFGIGVNNLNLIVLLLQLGGFLAALAFFCYYLYLPRDIFTAMVKARGNI